MQRKVFTPNDFPSLEDVAKRLANFERFAKASAMPRPMPLPAPVTTHTRPARPDVSFVLFELLFLLLLFMGKFVSINGGGNAGKGLGSQAITTSRLLGQ